MKPHKIVDAKGLACPLPIVKTKKMMDTLNSGEILQVDVTDKGALNDFKAWCVSGNHIILEMKEQENSICFYIQKA